MNPPAEHVPTPEGDRLIPGEQIALTQALLAASPWSPEADYDESENLTSRQEDLLDDYDDLDYEGQENVNLYLAHLVEQNPTRYDLNSVKALARVLEAISTQTQQEEEEGEGRNWSIWFIIFIPLLTSVFSSLNGD